MIYGIIRLYITDMHYKNALLMIVNVSLKTLVLLNICEDNCHFRIIDMILFLIVKSMLMKHLLQFSGVKIE